MTPPAGPTLAGPTPASAIPSEHVLATQRQRDRLALEESIDTANRRAFGAVRVETEASPDDGTYRAAPRRASESMRLVIEARFALPWSVRGLGLLAGLTVFAAPTLTRTMGLLDGLTWLALSLLLALVPALASRRGRLVLADGTLRAELWGGTLEVPATSPQALRLVRDARPSALAHALVDLLVHHTAYERSLAHEASAPTAPARVRAAGEAHDEADAADEGAHGAAQTQSSSARARRGR